jgi:hypothetical protein
MERRLRESTGRFREWTEMPRLRRTCGPAFLAITVALFLATVGAFGLGGLPFLLRFAVLLAYSGMAAVVGRVCWRAAQEWRLEGLGWAGASLAVAFLMTAPVAAFAWAVAWSLHGRVAAAPYPKLFLLTFAVSAAVCLLRGAIARPAQREAVPRLFRRLPVGLRHAELWAVQGEDHYVRFITAGGDALVHMRLGEALAELKAVPGAQVHRSWWVAERGVARVVRSGDRRTLSLKNGLEVPVSRTYRRLLRERGWF